MRIGILAAILLALSALPLAGCRLTYLFRVAEGQYRLLNGTMTVEEAMNQDSLGQMQKSHLALVEKIKDFAETELGLKKTSSYETVNLRSDQPTIYVVSSSPKDRLAPVTWWFPVIGSLPYLGFFDLESAQAEKRKLLEKDLDVVIGKAAAFSTLGWFRDPLTLPLIQGSTLDLVETLLHEMTHSTFYVKGQGEFNEGLAMLVGKEGAYLFMEKTYGPSHPLTAEARRSIEDERIFSPFLASLVGELNRLYNSALTYREKLVEREKTFALSLERFRQIRGQLQTDRFVHFEHTPLNNAFLVSVAIYHRHYYLFEKVLHRSGNSIKVMLPLLRNIAKEEGNMVVLMQEWLERVELHHSFDPEFPWEMRTPTFDTLGIG